MKKLYIIRHAKASWDNFDWSDFDRPLNDSGKKEAIRMAKLLKERNVAPDRLLTSAANRALATCSTFAEVLGFDEKKIISQQELYHASAETIMHVLASLPEYKDKEDVVLLFGHNPGITEFANALLNSSIDNIPTCGVVVATLSVDKWKEINVGTARMDWFDFPKK